MYSESPAPNGALSTSWARGGETQFGTHRWTLGGSCFCCNNKFWNGSQTRVGGTCPSLMGHWLWGRHMILPLPWEVWNALIPPPSLGKPGVGCKGIGRWVILGCLHYYPFDSGWGWRDYVTELQDSEAKLYFYHLSNYLWALNDGLKVKNRLNFSFPLPRRA